MGEQLATSGRDLWSGKTCRGHLAPTEDKTSKPSSKKSSASQSRKPPILMCLQRAGRHGAATATWTEDGLWLGACSTHNFGESPNAAVESRLSQILEAEPHQKYFLSEKACLGILRRAEKRGKMLPPILEWALKKQAGLDCDRPEDGGPRSYTLRIRGGCEGGGKGPLVQTEKSGTFGTGNDQTVFAFSAGMGAKAGNIGYQEQVSPTLRAGSGLNDVPSICYPINDKAPRCNGGGVTRNGDDSGNGLGIGGDGDPSSTLTAGDRHGVAVFPPVCGQPLLFENHSQDSRYKGPLDVSPMLPAHLGTGGNNTPFVVQAYSFDSLSSNSMKSSNPNSGCRPVDVSRTLDTSCPDPAKNQGGVAILQAVDVRNFREQDVNGTLQAKPNGGTSLNLNNIVRVGSFVRRLTPLECERLQGFPDGWTDIGEWTDSAGKRHKESSDSARYKAIGNSIALPPWKWVLKRISAQYTRDATMGSLFDGIGGFPLLWEQINGRGTCVWASEIEEFPIAITKTRL